LLLFFKIIGVSLVPSILILLQNDLGTTLVLAAIIAGVMLDVIPLTNITPAIIAANTNVVPRSFCSNIKILGTNDSICTRIN
jgi:cell division protein FtsW (lipid II flippase)